MYSTSKKLHYDQRNSLSRGGHHMPSKTDISELSENSTICTGNAASPSKSFGSKHTYISPKKESFES